MEWLPYAQIFTNAVIIIGLVIVGFIQKTRNEAMKGLTDNMSAFMSIFKVDEVEKYVKMKEETSKMEMEKGLRDLQKKLEEFNQQPSKEIPSQPLMQDIYKLFGNLSLYVPPSAREPLIDNTVNDIGLKGRLHEIRKLLANSYIDVNPTLLERVKASEKTDRSAVAREFSLMREFLQLTDKPLSSVWVNDAGFDVQFSSPLSQKEKDLIEAFANRNKIPLSTRETPQGIMVRLKTMSPQVKF